jgi:hypothetical protein
VHRAVHRDGPGSPSSQLARAFCAAVRPAARRGEFPGEDGLQAASTTLGKAIYGARKCTVEPVIGIIKEVLGFRQFSLRGELRRLASGVWSVWLSISSASIPYLGPNAGVGASFLVMRPPAPPFSADHLLLFRRLSLCHEGYLSSWSCWVACYPVLSDKLLEEDLAEGSAEASEEGASALR